MFGGNKYWAEIMAPAVGPKGHVTVWQPTQFLNDKRQAAFDAFAARQKNVTPDLEPVRGAGRSRRNAFDFMIINLDYHDIYWENAERKILRMDPNAWLKTLYAAMKPGGDGRRRRPCRAIPTATRARRSRNCTGSIPK